ncbi:uncharacterized protein C2845_PM01G38360 [Panicum miliaceum]|uniref:Secreted protein n=1 Tax=Panicum miliaceum TaxID=4540 RepID=A0A3L6TLP5_PANMI|nr:uncharacterized protein C2845_PM01G38360 [Panicum miliaceum]
MAGSTAVLAAILLVDLAAFGLAIGAVQSRPSAVAAFASRCFCCGAALRPGDSRACALVLFLSSWYY